MLQPYTENQQGLAPTPGTVDSLYSSFTLVLLMGCPSLDPTPACSHRATQYSGEAVREASVTAREHRVVHAASGLEWGQSSGPALHSLPLRSWALVMR